MLFAHLAFWTVPVATGIIRNLIMPALVALVNMFAHAGPPAMNDRVHGFTLLFTPAILANVSILSGSKDILYLYFTSLHYVHFL
jgi:hypothetical protein